MTTKSVSGSLKTLAALCLLTAAVCARADDPLSVRAESGDTEAMFALAQRLSAPEHGGDLTEAAKWYEAAAQADHAPSLLHMGRFYLNGTVVAANARAARNYFCKARDLSPAGSEVRRQAAEHCPEE